MPRPTDVRDVIQRAGRTAGPVLLVVSSSGTSWSVPEIATRARLPQHRVACAVWRLRRRGWVVNTVLPPSKGAARGRAPVRVRLADALWPACRRCGARHAGDQLCGVLL